MEENQLHVPNGWDEYCLGNILNYEQPYKYTVDSTDYNDKSGIPVLTAGKSFILGYTTELHDVYQNTPVIIFDDFTTDSKFVDFPFKVKSSAMKFLKPKNPDEFDIKIIFGYLQNLKIRETGGDHKRRWISEFSKLKVILPPFSEQTTIARILSKVDEAIAQTEQLIAKYTRIKTGLMQDLLTKGIDEYGKIRSEQTHEFKDSPLGRIPKEWECNTLISFCEKIQDGTHFSPKTDSNGAYKYITSKNIRMGHLDLTNLEHINNDAHKKIYRRCSVKYNDVLLTKDGASTGNICLNPLDEEFSLLSSVALIRGKKGKLLNEYIVQFFMEESGQKSLVDQMSGNAITRITLTKINNTQIKVPLFDEQQRIVQNLKSKENLIINERIKLSKLQSLKAGLMQDLLSGKVRVNHLIKETATT
ncbi:restriction endonuclease subunit S [Belliella sp. R4-6]|uniref:Restriction endonuclease subunit S n=1 Tax=Belliella alkalica TaxID=1730871 RepID=A0ABS9VE69_9BACT|nr:restriction endonuclease subunit S [Belliella alkalica]MCH7414330.1 restriction endonuclease subunit S [Belliella alkalica]